MGVSRRILVVDDYPSIATVTAMMATMEGYDVRVAHSGREALVIVEDFDPELIVLDLMLGGGLSGEEVLAAVRRREPPISVLVLSALVKNGRAPAVEPGDGVDLMAKPFKVRELSTRIAGLLADEQPRPR